MARSKVIYFGETLIDLTNDTVKKENLLKGFTAHGADGELVTGDCEFDVDSSAATAVAAEVLHGKKFAKGGQIQTGTMPNNGAASGTISGRDEMFTIPYGFHDGSGKAGISEEERAKIIPENIRDGVSLLGILGTMSGTEGAIPQTKTVNPSNVKQEILPDSGYNYLSSVTVNAIAYTESDNTAGGKTVTIG